jgi:hypothetical protein
MYNRAARHNSSIREMHNLNLKTMDRRMWKMPQVGRREWKQKRTELSLIRSTGVHGNGRWKEKLVVGTIR